MTKASTFDITDYLTDGKAELEGVWRSLGKDKAGHLREIRLARLNNDDYNSLLRAEQRKHQAVLDQQDDDAFKLAEQINKKAIAFTIIRGLRVDGVEVEYTPQLGLELLKSRDFHAKINSLAGQAEAYKEEQDTNLVND